MKVYISVSPPTPRPPGGIDSNMRPSHDSALLVALLVVKIRTANDG